MSKFFFTAIEVTKFWNSGGRYRYTQSIFCSHVNLCQVLYKELKFASHEIETSVGSMCTMWVWWYNNFLPGFSSKLVSSMAYWQKNCCAKSFTKRYLIGYPLKSTYCFWDTIHSQTISYIYLPNVLVYI